MSSFRIISLREKLSDLKEQIEISMQVSKNLSTSGQTSLHEQNETLKVIPSYTPKRSDAKVHLDSKIEVSENSLALIYVWLDLSCLFWGNKWWATWKADIKVGGKPPSPL